MTAPFAVEISAVEMSVLGSHLGDFWTHDGRTVALVGVSSVVVMVFLLSDEEIDGFFDGGHDRVVVDVAHVGDDGHSLSSLFFGKRHDARAVLRADVIALPIELGRVMDGEEDLKERFVGDDGRVKLDFHHLGVAGGAAADRLVGGMGVVATCVGGERRLNAVDLFVSAFNAPKASSTDDHPFHSGSRTT